MSRIEGMWVSARAAGVAFSLLVTVRPATARIAAATAMATGFLRICGSCLDSTRHGGEDGRKLDQTLSVRLSDRLILLLRRPSFSFGGALLRCISVRRR